MFNPKKYYLENKKRINKYNKKYSEEHKEETKDTKRSYYLLHRVSARKESSTKSAKEIKFKTLYGRFPTKSELDQFIKSYSKY